MFRFALDRFPSANKNEYKGYLDAFNQIAQCVGSIVVAPLIRKFPTKTVLSFAMGLFAIICAIPLILEASTGGKFSGPGLDAKGNPKANPGSWNPLIVIPIFTVTGLAHGCIELIRRVIPRDIVGGNVTALKKMDSLVHIFYEVAGTSGAFFSTFMAISLGKAFGTITAPFAFIVATIIWFRIKVDKDNDTFVNAAEEGVEGDSVWESVSLFFVSIYEGGKIIFSNRKFTWLIFGYSIPLFLHRFLENHIGDNFAKYVLKEGGLNGVITGGSNFGELLGALLVFSFTTWIHTPLPWLRLDAALLAIVWLFYKASPTVFGVDYIATAWIVAACLVPMSLGWAAGDVSLAAFIQSHVSRIENKKVSPLGAVMAFLYVLYIILYAVLSVVAGKYIDSLPKNAKKEPIDISPYFFWFGGVMFTLCGVLIFASTFVPKGSFSLNPSILPEHIEEEEKKKVENSATLEAF
ncbi:hypothetical protein HK099_008185 [Clydaea vesicula]|uniref:Uncharacterized protein n=1 Tax=Clydaea vesicula TaxID=447962 RepID=A0AAD5TZ36_9FUNG|nr:hypothetical protein HK099_008185 [Clydaea vesicula]